MKFYVIIFLMFLVSSCTSKYSKDNYQSTHKLNDSLFIERYMVYNGGVFASNSNSYYLTDSMSFRSYLYTITEDSDGLDVELRDSILYVYKITPKESIEVNRINIQEAKHKGIFEWLKMRIKAYYLTPSAINPNPKYPWISLSNLVSWCVWFLLLDAPKKQAFQPYGKSPLMAITTIIMKYILIMKKWSTLMNLSQV